MSNPLHHIASMLAASLSRPAPEVHDWGTIRVLAPNGKVVRKRVDFNRVLVTWRL